MISSISWFTGRNPPNQLLTCPQNTIILADHYSQLYRLKALVALPKTSGAIARAIAKEYPSMRALLNAYLDSAKSVSVCPSQPGTLLVLASRGLI
jgi:hypothetical protein